MQPAYDFRKRYPALFKLRPMRGRREEPSPVVEHTLVPPDMPVAAFLRRHPTLLGIYVPAEVAGVEEIWVQDEEAAEELRKRGWDGEINYISQFILWE